MLRLAAAKHGIQLDVVPANPLEGLPADAIAELLAVRCFDCVEIRDRPSLSVRA
jgi:hypothetical protein